MHGYTSWINSDAGAGGESYLHTLPNFGKISNFGAVGDGSVKGNVGKVGKIGKISNFGAVGVGSDKGNFGKVGKI